MSNHIQDQLKAAFGSNDLYGIFSIDKTASQEEIKRAFRKLALVHHPDKGGSDEKFKAIVIVNNILSDPTKRAEYDASGFEDENRFDDDDTSGEENYEFWYSFYRNLFPKVTVNDIESFKQKYIGSEEEKADIVKAYNASNGNMNMIIQSIFFIEENDEDMDRLCQLIDTLIQENSIDSLPSYEKFKQSRSNKENKSRKGKKRKAKTSTEDSSNNFAELAELMRERRDNSQGKQAMAAVVEKYSHLKKGRASKAAEEEDDIPDDEFERIQSELMSKSHSSGRSHEKTSSTTSKKSKRT